MSPLLGRALADRAGLVVALVGVIAAGGAWRWMGTPGGAMLWTLVLAIACAGYGRALERFGGPRSFGMTVVSGLAFLLVVSTVLARLGLLPPPVQFAAVAVGIAANAVGSHAVTLPRVPVCITVVIGGCLLIGMRVCGGETWLADAVNHPMAVKQLWDTAGLGPLAHQGGAQLVGESYVALIGGPITAGAFDGGLCAALLVLLLATELAEREDGFGPSLFVVLLVPIVLHLDYAVPTARWSGTVFLVAMFVALHRAIVDRRNGWDVLPFAVVLVAIRYEFALLAAPYAIAAIVMPGDRARRTVALGLVAWLGVLFAVGGLRGGLLGVAASAMSLVVVRIVVPVITTFSWRSTLAVALFAAVMMAVGPIVRAVPSAAHGRSGMAILIWGTAFCIVLLIDREVLGRDKRDRRGDRLRAVPAAVFLVILVNLLVLAPNFDGRRWRLRQRYADVMVKFQAIRIAGYDQSHDLVVRALQDRAPAGASLGFWGASGSALDFARNPIRDLSWNRQRFLATLDPEKLDGLDYVIVQAIEPPLDRGAEPDAWGELPPSPMANVVSSLRWVAELDSTTLYRVAR